MWGAAATWRPASLRLPCGHTVALMSHGLDFQAGLGTAAPPLAGQAVPLSRNWNGNCTVSQGGGCSLAGLGAVRAEGWTETENTVDLWASQERQQWLWNHGRSLRLNPPTPRREQCQCPANILPVKVKLICLCGRYHMVELRACEGV